MNTRKLTEAGVPPWAMGIAMQAVQGLAHHNREVAKTERIDIRERIGACVKNPAGFSSDPLVNKLAEALLEDRLAPTAVRQSIAYRTWGPDGIDAPCHEQMRQACALPGAVGAALMADAHVGYGLPIGGVLALENAVCPYAVGVDIACRMKLTVYDVTPADFSRQADRFRQALQGGTVFGVGKEQKHRVDHPVMDQDWGVSRITREKHDVAWRQLGTSGSGNHFVEWGTLTLEQPDLGLEARQYMALLSHSGSRGTGAAVCSTYSEIARAKLPRQHADVGRLAWLPMDTEAGQEYFAAMNLMGDYAAANHDVIHKVVARLLGEKPMAGVENHHNFCWLEEHAGKQVYVHRKGATPAGKGVLGVIPGSMGSPAFVVRGLGHADSLHSASHGAGRLMSRTQARQLFNLNKVRRELAHIGIEVLAAGSDEVPGVYKNIHQVMESQKDLVTAIARFDPRMVLMCGDGSKAED
ncbi:MAG: RtcB family protein [Planctomycetota bacterium]|nr:RtcB family protein [Planctomycetota bacterium]